MLGARQPGDRGDAELAPALRLLAKVLLSPVTQQSTCAALLCSHSAWRRVHGTLQLQSCYFLNVL